MTAYAPAFASLLLLGGRTADLFGRKPAFLVDVAGFAAASGRRASSPRARSSRSCSTGAECRNRTP
ncbi:hypothetical protein AQI88_09435 [Streptomyces cellostaticus]|uniref:Uncharacterized protein n=1 Tax=Streptomyces cellostaticus TaxID=67285 RepID=A0A101NQ18_9ACTN|nr:hypothetical protein AQI88_09435 [Streptomyces cellostaticus]